MFWNQICYAPRAKENQERKKCNAPRVGYYPRPKTSFYSCVSFGKVVKGSGIHFCVCLHHKAAWAEVKSVLNTLTSQQIWPVNVSKFNICICICIWVWWSSSSMKHWDRIKRKSPAHLDHSTNLTCKTFLVWHWRLAWYPHVWINRCIFACLSKKHQEMARHYWPVNKSDV